MTNTEDLLALGCYCRDRVNAQLFAYALSVAIVHRQDTKNLQLPTLFEMFPDKYIDGAAFLRANEEARIVPAGKRVSIFAMNFIRFSSQAKMFRKFFFLRIFCLGLIT